MSIRPTGPAAPTAGPVVTGAVEAACESLALGTAALAAYALAVGALSRIGSVAPSDDLLGGMWSAVAAVFVCKISHQDSARAAVTRTAATLLSLALTLAYLLVQPFHAWGMALVVAVGALVSTLARQPDDVTTGAITSIVIMVVAAIEPHDAWLQPILRLADTAVGILIGLAVAWVLSGVVRRART